MPIRDVAARNASLNNDYGTTRGPNAPSSHQLALFYGDPMFSVEDGGGTEVVGNGYARQTVNPTDWLDSVDGRKNLVTPKQFPNTTAEWDDTVTHWALFANDGVTMWDCGPLAEPFDVTAAAAGPIVDVTVFYDSDVDDFEE